jgi:hypothetical protein
MSVRASSKKVAQPAPEIVFTLFGSHCDFRISPTLADLRAVTIKQSWDLSVPLSREDVSVAERADAC